MKYIIPDKGPFTNRGFNKGPSEINYMNNKKIIKCPVTGRVLMVDIYEWERMLDQFYPSKITIEGIGKKTNLLQSIRDGKKDT